MLLTHRTISTLPWSQGKLVTIGLALLMQIGVGLWLMPYNYARLGWIGCSIALAVAAGVRATTYT